MAASAAALVAGCSNSGRFSDPFSDPFGSSAPPPAAPQRAPRSYDRAPTGSINPPSTAPIKAQPLAPPTTPAAASAAPVPAHTPSGGDSHWTAEGGTPVTLGEGETAGIVASRYGVPTDVLLRVNGYTSAAKVAPGAHLIIPVYRANGAVKAVPTPKAKVASATPAAAPTPVAAPKPQVAKVEHAEPKPAPAPKAQVAKAEKAQPAPVKVAKAEEPKKIDKAPAKPKAEKPVAAATIEKPTVKAKEKLAKAEPVAPSAPAPQKQAAKPVEKHESVKVAREEPAAAPVKPVEEHKIDRHTTTAAIPPAAVEKTADAAHPEFRWPARGRVIQGFANGGNDGINISVPEGTQVKAAESGVVAYAGSELKGYGNLVLIRHPNGFVSAYAHNGELSVKRGDQVSRGQTIAKSGQSGNVASPQLHFELRKGSTPVDPTGYLAGT
jgi:murein DD-endopeptidase MepM/ murein hydrolase activator NlpD